MNLLAFLLALPLVLAQVGPQATQLPACIKACDPAAIASVNCTNADQYCHCVKQNGILSNISACANRSCSDASAELYTFTTLFGQVCEQFNISVPVLGDSGNNKSTTAANSTTMTNGTQSGNGTSSAPGPTLSILPITAMASLSSTAISPLVAMILVACSFAYLA